MRSSKKEPRRRPGQEQHGEPSGRLPDSPAAELANVSREASSLERVPLPWRSSPGAISRAGAELPCFIGTSPNGNPGQHPSSRAPLEPRGRRCCDSNFALLDFVSRSKSPLTCRDRGRMGGMAVGLGLASPPPIWPGGWGLSISYVCENFI